MKNLLWATLLLAGGTARAQHPKTASPYLFSTDIAASLRAKPTSYQYAAWDYSRIGRYQEALDADNQGHRPPPRPLPHADSLMLAAYVPTDARAYILARASRERIVIINEAHHVPRHRAFTASLLPGLAAQGYHYLAVEDLLETDSLNWPARPYPVLASGDLVSEPNMGRLLRVARQQGFRLRCYNYGFSREGDWPTRQRAREMAQARNIQRILRADPQAKIVVHCGYSHASELPDPEDGGRWLASYLREFTGIDPFTIDQTNLSEGSRNRYYQPAQLGLRDAVLVNGQDQPFNKVSNFLSTDVVVYHPPAPLVQGRPDWLFAEGRRPVAVADKIKVPYPCLVLAYAADEPPQAVPLDVIELTSATGAPALALGPGRYRLEVRSQGGATQQLKLRL